MVTEVIRPKFDVVRGWPNGSAYDKTFDLVQDGSGDPLKIKEGSFVTVNAAGAAIPATVGITADEFLLYMVIEGNDPDDSFSGDYLDKVVAIRGAFEVLLSTTHFVAGAYAPGTQVSILAGQVKIADGSNVGINGYVTAYDSAADELKVALTL